MTALTIGKLAAAEGVSVETIRFYQRTGLLALPERTLSEIRDLLGPAEARSVQDVTAAAETKLAAVTDQIAGLNALACRLRWLLRVCAHGSREDCLALQVRPGQEGAVR